jgi:hypothetical protein
MAFGLRIRRSFPHSDSRLRGVVVRECLLPGELELVAIALARSSRRIGHARQFRGLETPAPFQLRT